MKKVLTAMPKTFKFKQASKQASKQERGGSYLLIAPLREERGIGI
jgi:hypothetical protein